MSKKTIPPRPPGSYGDPRTKPTPSGVDPKHIGPRPNYGNGTKVKPDLGK